MKDEKDRFEFTRHALDRALERMLDLKPPYNQVQYDNIKKLICKNMVWLDIAKEWRLHDYRLRLIIEEDTNMVLSIVPFCVEGMVSKPLTQWQKEHTKKAVRIGKMRNLKSKDQK